MDKNLSLPKNMFTILKNIDIGMTEQGFTKVDVWLVSRGLGFNSIILTAY